MTQEEFDAAVVELIERSDPAAVVLAVAEYCHSQRGSTGHQEFANRIESVVDNFSYSFDDDDA